MNDDNNDNGISNIIGVIEGVAKFVEENEEMLSSITGGVSPSGYNGELTHLKPLREVTKTDDSYEVIMEVDAGGDLDIELSEGDGYVVMRFAGNRYKVNVPSNADISEADASLNNGVLTVDIPIDEEQEPDVTVSVNDNEEKLEEDEE